MTIQNSEEPLSGVPYYHIGGLMPAKKLVELCQIDSTKKILMVGCGTSFSACYLAREIGCEVMGIDITELSIGEAKERAKRQGVSDKAKFRAGNAYDLLFEAGTFDAVITEFVSQFLDRGRAFKEFSRVLKPGAYLGTNETYREKEILVKTTGDIAQAEKHGRNNWRNLDLCRVIYKPDLENGKVLYLKQKNWIPVQKV